MDLGLKGKNAAITGSSQGIGYAIASSLADEGCNVALSARNQERLDQAVADMEAKGVKAVGIICDLSTEAGCGEFIEKAAAELGGLDILVNNVGGMIPGTIDSVDDALWDTILNTNLMSFVHTTKHAIPHIKKSGAGRVLNVSGVTGKQLMPGALTTTIPNTAIHGFAKIMAAELGPDNITVNTICPGFTNTESWGPRADGMAKMKGITADQVRDGVSGMTLLGRWAEPQEIGDAAAWMVSGKNSYQTGTVVEVCGGYTKYI
ncbi:MAG: SDR family oxidoreductase [Rhodospirillaceae bacterium]|jgi:3-oxoacyl-[acyl-carrier protein] reductase|nr:SDR family oxidoreductase [Rhodospirillaceae bacterium]MBT4588854.1 SDR family oxidoreductase [Rhodospirillaceae bacterium]MBT4939650.1 SDR family oxidoreductase [Rhodospirillaceae bacterium]MBT5940966.1 SDR family oxidoreductase [Rhodospirillaceae bacterium]MBT7266854.1 SDR family oxidoreductase [Rhodospirillaceae bacterium]